MNNAIQIPIEIAKNLLMAIPTVRRVREKVSRKRSEILENFNRPFQVSQDLLQRLDGKFDFKGKTVLEIGPGNSLCMGLFFLSMGAKKVYIVDRFKHLFWDKKDILFHRTFVSEIVSKDFPFQGVIEKAMTMEDRGITLNPNLIEYRIGDVARLPLENSCVDFAFSNAVLEHVHQPEQVINELARVTRPGGWGSHEIDLRDHFFKATPLRLLGYSDALWNLMTSYRPGYANRLRFSDYIKLFEKHSFNVIKLTYTRELENDQLPKDLKLNRKFRNYSPEELKILAFWVLLKKNEKIKHAL